MERLQKIIANSGYCSRRKAEELISLGKVQVNGNVINEFGLKIDGKDIVTIEGRTISREEKEYYLLNKPRGVVTTTNDEKGRKTVVDLIDTNTRIYPVGRLDYDTTGVLILTNDGELTNKLTHPRSNINKKYLAKIKGILNISEIKKLENGVIIDGVKTARAKVKVRKVDKVKQTSLVELTIHEGKNHQVKNMFDAIGHEVVKLKREEFSFLTDEGLNTGEYRKLSVKEVKKLYNEVINKD